MSFVPYREKVRQFEGTKSGVNHGKSAAKQCLVFCAAEPMEHCALCGRETDVPRLQNIWLRSGYVEGCGQLCPDCRRALDAAGKK